MNDAAFAHAPRILLAERDPAVVRSSANTLVQAGRRVAHAGDADALIAQLEKGDVALLVLEAELPGNRGLELVQAIRERWPSLPLVLTSAQPNVSSAIAALRLEVVDYLPRPVEAAALLAAVRRGLSRARGPEALALAASDPAALGETLEDIAALLREGVAKGRAGRELLTMEGFLGRSLASIAATALAMSRALAWQQGAARGRGGEDLCQVLTCPRRERHEVLLAHVVEVLRQTKGAFKSKRLAELRRRIERFLEEEERSRHAGSGGGGAGPIAPLSRAMRDAAPTTERSEDGPRAAQDESGEGRDERAS